MLRDLVVSEQISPTESTYYPIYLPQGVNASLGSAVACVDFCGYHGTIDISDIPTAKIKYLYYAIIPDQSGWCMGGCGESLDPFHNICGLSTHEFAEAVTNPAISVATGLAPPVGWYAAGFGEIGDLCTMMEGELTDPITNTTWTVDKL
ncbi:hypothetical protein BC830DRAFT_538637 [Chytriomyces sp. MP71]|nr:hypothetical protein BC830DRAFT_538637 [Chytriomyces sp. MP71]